MTQLPQFLTILTLTSYLRKGKFFFLVERVLYEELLSLKLRYPSQPAIRARQCGQFLPR